MGLLTQSSDAETLSSLANGFISGKRSVVNFPWQLHQILTALESYRGCLVLGNELGFVCSGLSRENADRL